MAGITWLASYPKSGNTWLRLFLTNLFLNRSEPASINEVATFGFSDSARPLYEKLNNGPIGDPNPARLVQLRFALQQALARNPADYVLCKTHWPRSSPEGQLLLDPRATAGAVYLVRDPRDVAVSFAYHMNLSFDKAIRIMASPRAMSKGEGAKVREFFSDWSTHVRSWTAAPAANRCIVRYEDLRHDPHSEFNRVVRFLYFTADAERIARAVRHASLDVAQAQEGRADFKERSSSGVSFFRKGTAGAFRQELSAAKIAQIERDHAEVMRSFGYAPQQVSTAD